MYRVIQLTIATEKNPKLHYLLIDFKKKKTTANRLQQLLTKAIQRNINISSVTNFFRNNLQLKKHKLRLYGGKRYQIFIL